MDMIYLINSLFFEPPLKLLKMLTCGKVDLTKLSDKINYIYVLLFDMTDMDIAGFRRLRTISQLSFESLPQIILQTRILMYMKEHPNDSFHESVSLDAIVASLIAAALHFVIEFVYVRLECIACRTTFMHYCIVCFNGRFGWLPFTNLCNSCTGNVAIDDERKKVLDYDHITTQFMCAKFAMEF